MSESGRDGARAVAVNVGANTSDPGFRGPIYPDGSFTFLPIPETAPTSEAVPTYGDLSAHLPVTVPEDVRDRPVHLDPEFATYPECERYTYGDPHGVKAGPLSDLAAGDVVLFYATLTTATASDLVTSSAPPPDWQAPEWGAYLVGEFRLARDPVTPRADGTLPAADRERFATNAHRKRDPFDARVLLLGDPDRSRLYETAVPLSSSSAGAEANWLVTECSSDSGRGPWWRRPLRYDADGLATLRAAMESPDVARTVAAGPEGITSENGA